VKFMEVIGNAVVAEDDDRVACDDCGDLTPVEDVRTNCRGSWCPDCEPQHFCHAECYWEDED
jgi:hypothetical protein